MGQAKQIYFKDDVVKLLEEEENVSELINNLLREYYGNEELATKDRLSKIYKEAKDLEEKIEIINQHKEIAKENNKNVEVKHQDNKEDRLERTKLIQRDAFEIFVVPQEIKEQVFEEFWSMFKEGTIKNLFQFMEIRGFKRKPKKKCEDN